MSNHQIIVLTGPSGVGKSVLVQRLVKSALVKKCITCTTRLPRASETNGVDYHFLNEAEFQIGLKEGAFIESNTHYDNMYGVRYSDLKILLKQSHVVILLNWEGALSLAQAFEGVSTIFIKPPSLEVLQKRLSGRRDDLRMQYAEEDMSHANKFDYQIVNDDLEDAYQRLEKMVQKILMEK